jgi:hypothetical protein
VSCPIRGFVAASEPGECFVLSNVHLFELGRAKKLKA